jgi:hypothetical protein
MLAIKHLDLLKGSASTMALRVTSYRGKVDISRKHCIKPFLASGGNKYTNIFVTYKEITVVNYFGIYTDKVTWIVARCFFVDN